MNMEQTLRGVRVGVLRCQSLTMPGGAPSRMTLRMAGKDGKPAYLPELLVQYKKDCKAGWKCPSEMKAKAPEGWEGVVLKLKDHPEVDNPYALTNWMSDKGYKPHFTRTGKPKK